MNPEHLDAYISGELRDDSARFIESAIRRDEALQDEVYLQAQVDQALRWLHADGERVSVGPALGQPAEDDAVASELEALQEDEFVAGVMASVSAGDENSLARSVLTELLDERQRKTRPGPWWDLAKAAAVAAAAVVVTVVVLKSVEVEDETVLAQRAAVEEARLLAQITRESDASWGESGTVHRDGKWLGSGLLHLESGVAEVTFDNGARVILEGPCYLDIETPQRAYLRRGRVTAEVPPPAVGFVINTPSMNVVDLGTRFGLEVMASGTSELHVMEGLVEASRSGGRAVPVQLREGLAVRADQRTRSHLQPIEYGGDRFALRAGSEVIPPPPTVYYRFDETVGPVLEDSGGGFEGGPYEASLFSTGDNPGAVKTTPRRSSGRVGSGLVFHRGESLATPMPADLGAGLTHTVACWVKLPPKGGAGAGATILSLGPAAGPDRAGLGDDSVDPVQTGWRLRSNAESADGPLGALRVDCGDGFVIGTTDLRDGRWHHVAYRFGGSGASQEADIATHVRLFVDGRLETIGAYRSCALSPVEQIAETASGGAGDGAVFLGIGSLSRDAAAGFEGSVDEVVISRGALDPTVIHELARHPERRAPGF